MIWIFSECVWFVYFSDVELFASEMKYLHDNGFKVIPMSDLGYDQITNYMYIRTK